MSAASARVRCAADAAAVADLAARFVAVALATSIAERGECRLALAGGATPRATYARLALPDLASAVDWGRVAIFFGDERMVPPGDTDSNYRSAREALLDRVPVLPANVHRIRGELPAEEAISRYEAALGQDPLDLVLLGMGGDGHVASLFPGGPELASPGRVLSTVSPLPPHRRITLGFTVIDAARQVAFLVTGAAKASRVARVFAERRAGGPAASLSPAARVAPRSGEPYWFLDSNAAAELCPGEDFAAGEPHKERES